MVKLWLLLALNIAMFAIHIHMHCKTIFYFFHLTIIGQSLVIVNFILSIVLAKQKSQFETKLFLSRFHLMTLALQFIVVFGFWGLRITFPKGIIKEGEERTIFWQIMCFWVHGGSFLTMFYFLRKDCIVREISKAKKIPVYLCWGFSFLLIQYLSWMIRGEHLYGFLKHFSWFQLISFELAVLIVAISVDYFFMISFSEKIEVKGGEEKDK